ncbi:hypothetical protein [Mesorhizobium sp. M0618]|uniref:hypothetical protein n=1 Tax=unclassified Mesorhizobium TaxID=325217 RepID=UPI0033379134
MAQLDNIFWGNREQDCVDVLQSVDRRRRLAFEERDGMAAVHHQTMIQLEESIRLGVKSGGSYQHLMAAIRQFTAERGQSAVGPKAARRERASFRSFEVRRGFLESGHAT